MQFVHLSDLHFRPDWNEEMGQVLKAFLEDISELSLPPETYIIFSGDIVQAGGDVELYAKVESELLRPLELMGFGPEKIIMVPGNHDVDSNYVKDNVDTLLGISTVLTDETQTNNFILRASKGVFGEKFSNYALFEACNARYGCGPALTGSGYTLPDGTGIYCLNSALMSFGGQKTSFGEEISDQGRLAIETRGLNSWLQSNTHARRVMIVHHPADWLTEWASSEFSNLVRSNFDICVHGHVHEQKLGLFHHDRGNSLSVTSPALFTRKSGELGYSIIQLEGGSVQIKYRQWAKPHAKFVLGSVFSGNDGGAVSIQLAGESVINASDEVHEPRASLTMRHFRDRFRSSLNCYGAIEPIWVQPELSEISEGSRNSGSAVLLDADAVAADQHDALIKAPPQYGLTAVGLAIALAKLELSESAMPLMANTSDIPSHEAGLLHFAKEAVLTQSGVEGVPTCLIFDEFEINNQLHVRKFKTAKKLFPKAQIIILVTVDDAKQLDRKVAAVVADGLLELNLWTLSRGKVRELVRSHIQAGSKLLEDSAVARLLEHLDSLNLPRTAHNCLTLLTIFEGQVDASPVNRTEVIGLFLSILFSTMQSVPKYNTIPDLKDSLFALGYLCERFVRIEKYEFSRAEFFQIVGEYCSSQLIDIEIDTLFLMLCGCNLLILRDGRFSFRFVYWIHFFAAHRMHHDESFYEYMIENRRYANYPEVIEFYSGIDRRSTNLLKSLLSDLNELNNSFVERTKFSDDFDAFTELMWSPDPAQIEEVRATIETEANGSNLPVEVKDAIADKMYDRSKPYTQEIRHFLDDASMAATVRVMKCAARALRNSDHADVDVRRHLLDQVMLTWARELRLLTILSPVLARDGRGQIDGLGFYLTDSYDRFEGEDKWIRIMSSLHFNIGNFYGQDFYSSKMGPLYSDFMKRTKDVSARHLMLVQLIREKPKGWHEEVSKYIETQSKNSFYLSDVAREVKRSFDIGFDGPEEKIRLRQLVGLAYGKHFKGNNPGRKVIDGTAASILDKKPN